MDLGRALGAHLAQGVLLPEPSGAREPGPGPHPSYTLLLPSYSLSQVGPESPAQVQDSPPLEPGPGSRALLLPSYSLSQVGPESPAQVHTPPILSYSPPTP